MVGYIPGNARRGVEMLTHGKRRNEMIKRETLKPIAASLLLVGLGTLATGCDEVFEWEVEEEEADEYVYSQCECVVLFEDSEIE